MENKLELSNGSNEDDVSQLTSALNNLSPEERILVTSKCNFEAVMSEFQKQNWGKYDWLPLNITQDAWSGFLIAKSGGFTGILQIMESHHKHCDTTYVTAENTFNDGDKDLGKNLLQSFIWNMELHFAREEEILFPAFEQKTGMVGGPTQVMRTEHTQIKGLLKEISDCIVAADFQRIFDLSETMLILIAQHNSKEENILYPMTDQHLAGDADSIAKHLQLFTLS